MAALQTGKIAGISANNPDLFGLQECRNDEQSEFVRDWEFLINHRQQAFRIFHRKVEVLKRSTLRLTFFSFVGRLCQAVANWHTFQVLTKCTERLEEVSPQIDWPENVWIRVSVENQDYTFRVDHLRRTGAKTKYLSLETLFEPLPGLNLTGINWAIVGGESPDPAPGLSCRNG